MRKALFIIIVVIIGLTDNSIAQLKMATPYPPQIFHGIQFTSIVYEIHLIDSLKRPIEFMDFLILSENKILLHDSICDTVPKNKEKNRYIKYIWINIDQPTNVLTHKIKYKIGDENFEFTKDLIIDNDSVISIGFPVEEGVWYMLAGPSPKSDHRHYTMSSITRYDSAQNGYQLGYCNQRFAIDFNKVGDNGLLYKNDGHKNSDFYCYGHDVIAVSDGIILGLLNSVKENKHPPIIDKIRDNNDFTGNLILLDIGNGIIASYAHLMPNSIQVNVGDSVKKGDIIGKIGNSGNSTAPHLHFHLSKPDYQRVDLSNVLMTFWLSEGLSFVFDKYQKYSIKSGKFVDVDGNYDSNLGKFVVNGTTEFISEPFVLSNPKEAINYLPFENEIIKIK